MNDLKKMVEVLGLNKQAFFTAVHLSNIQQQLNICKPLPPINNNIPQKEAKKIEKKEAKNDGK
jgi:hypothetical protein